MRKKSLFIYFVVGHDGDRSVIKKRVYNIGTETETCLTS